MGHQEAGDGSAYPVSFQIPDDGDSMNASSVNVAYEALADRTAWLKEWLDPLRANFDSMMALNYQAPGITGAPIFQLNTAFFVPAYECWVACGTTANVCASRVGGWSFVSETLTGAAGENCFGGDCDVNGNCVVSTDGRYIFQGVPAGGAWTKVDVRGNPVVGQIAVVTHDPTIGVWSYVQDGLCYTSTNRTAWTVRTPPAGWPNPATPGLVRAAVRKTNGVTCAMLVDGTTLRPGRSINGGVNWTAGATLTTTITSATEANLYCVPDPAKGGPSTTWIYVVGKTTGSGSCEVWRSSDDGLTWVKIATFANACVLGFAAVGLDNVLVGAARPQNRLIVSFDLGATWRLAGFAMNTIVRGAYGPGSGGTLLLSSSTVYPPLRASTNPGPVLT